MRVVVDTNVFISAAMKETSLPSLVVRRIERSGVLLKSVATERQLMDVLDRPYFSSLISSAARAWLESLLVSAESVVIAERVAECRDSTDDKFLELAVNGKAGVIVSGDKDLLVMHPFREIPVFTPASFLAWSG